MACYPPDARAVRSAGYGQGKLQMGGPSANVYRPNAPYHVGTPANLQRKPFDNWSAKKRAGMGDFGHASNVVYWGDYKARDDRMRDMRARYELNEDRRQLIREAFDKLDGDGDGVVSLDDVRRVYVAASHPMVRSKQWTEEQAYLDFVARFKGSSYEPGRTQSCLSIRLDDFEGYYEGVGAELDDEYFAAMMVQAWRLHKRSGGHMPGQGWGQPMLDQLALAEANMMGDAYLGMADLIGKKLESVVVRDDHEAMYDKWAAKVRASARAGARAPILHAAQNPSAETAHVLCLCIAFLLAASLAWQVRGGGFGDMLKCAEEILSWCGQREALGDLANLAPVCANSVRFVRMGGSELLTSLCEAQDTLIKRATAAALFAVFSEELARVELSRGKARWTQVRDPPLPAPVPWCSLILCAARWLRGGC